MFSTSHISGNTLKSMNRIYMEKKKHFKLGALDQNHNILYKSVNSSSELQNTSLSGKDYRRHTITTSKTTRPTTLCLTDTENTTTRKDKDGLFPSSLQIISSVGE